MEFEIKLTSSGPCVRLNQSDFLGWIIKMGIINMIKTIKQIHKNDIILLKIGKFYHTYGKDSYIIAYLFWK